MPSPPAFQFYADDFLAGTIDMTAEEVGAYMRLLCLQWTKGAITDRQKLSVGVSKEVAETVLSLKFVKQKDGTFVNVRLEEVRNLRENYAKKKSDAGKKGAESRWHSHTSANGKRIAEGMAKGMAEGMANDSSSVSSLHIKKKKTKGKDKDRDGMFSELWEVWPRLRRSGMADAEKAWAAAVQKADPEVILSAAREYAISEVGTGQYVKGPATWLRKGCWEDDRESWKDSNGHSEISIGRLI